MAYPGVRLVDHPEAGVLCTESIAHFPGPVGGSVVHDYAFKAGISLSRDALKAFFQKLPYIINRYDNADHCFTLLSFVLPVFQPEKIRTPESVEYLKSLDADLYVVAAFGQILSQEVLDIPKYGCVNIHASLLPKYRGAAPIQQALLDGNKETGVTLMQMNAGMDTGDILMQESLEITDEDTAGTLFDKLMDLGADMIVRAVPMIEKGELTPVPQDNDKATKVGKFSKEMGIIDWSKDAAYIDRLIRTMDPWPSAFTHWNEKTLKIWKAKPIEASSGSQAGEIFEVGKNSFKVACGSGSLEVCEVQLEGKKRMLVKDFLLGNKIEIGTKLG